MNPSPLFLKSEDRKELFLSYDSNDPIYVYDIGYHKTPPCHAFGPTVRPYYLLHLIESGKGIVERNGIVTALSAGEAFLIRPDEIVTYCSDEKEPWTYRWISFYGDFAKTLLARTTDRLFMPYQKSGLIALENALQKGPGDYMQCMNALLEVLNAIKSDRPLPAEHDAITAALSYLENNYFRNIDIRCFAAQLGFSRSYFTTQFTKRTGETPYNYLTKIRLEKSKTYLQNSTYSVEQIAYSVGFSSLQRFSEMFKKYVGVSPSQFRKNSV